MPINAHAYLTKNWGINGHEVWTITKIYRLMKIKYAKIDFVTAQITGPQVATETDHGGWKVHTVKESDHCNFLF